MTTTWWHVTGPDYTPGDDLLSWDALVARGDEPVWKWDEAPEGQDGHMVCLFPDTPEGRQERDWLADDIPGAQVLRIRISEDDDRIVWTRAEYETYGAVIGRIPGDVIGVVQ